MYVFLQSTLNLINKLIHSNLTNVIPSLIDHHSFLFPDQKGTAGKRTSPQIGAVKIKYFQLQVSGTPVCE